MYVQVMCEVTLPTTGLLSTGRDGQGWLSTHVKVTLESLGTIFVSFVCKDLERRIMVLSADKFPCGKC